MATILMDRLVERVASESLRVDTEAGVIRDVKILGRQSRNNRRYTEQAMRGAVHLFEGIGVFVDHPSRSDPDADRSVRDKFGVLKSVRYVDSALRGDLWYLKAHPAAPQIIEAAQRFPQMIGLSQHAGGRTRTENGTIVVESIDEVLSVDIVVNPASTTGLFESTETTLIADETANGLGMNLTGFAGAFALG